MDNKELSKVLRKQFAQTMAEQLPQFEPQGGKGKIQLTGWRSFLWSVADDLHFLVALGVDAQGEMFTVEGAWNATADYPAGQTPLLVPNLKAEQVSQDRVVFRLGMKDGTGAIVERTWWEPQSEGEEEPLDLIEEAVERVRKEFLPPFLKRASKKGIRLGR